jgi:sugar lactone lactonase YvrE
MVASILLLLALLTTSTAALAESQVEVIAVFDPMVPETPESLVFDHDDNAYLSMALTGEIRKIAPDGSQSTVAFLPIEPPCGGQFPPVVVLGLAIDFFDHLYAAVTACNPANTGIWKVDKDDGTIELLANLPSFTVANGIDVFLGKIYIADTFGGMIWRVPTTGGIAEIWSDDPLLALPPMAPFPGPNGVRYFRGEIYVAVSVSGTVVAIPINPDGSAGEARVHATLPDGSGCDEFVFDLGARIYCTTSPFQTLVRLDPDGTSEILLDLDDGVDGPSSVAFGRKIGNRRNLYMTNAAFPWQASGNGPSLMKLPLEVWGAP